MGLFAVICARVCAAASVDIDVSRMPVSGRDQQPSENRL
jgi:hypothetical protein